MTPEELASLPRTREEARQLGAKFYFTGKPCKHGHVGERYSQGLCRGCAKLRDNSVAHAIAVKEHQCRARARDPVLYWLKVGLRAARSRAKKAKVPFCLTVDDVLPLCASECPALGIPMVYNNRGGCCDNSASIDRRVPEMGYVPDNIDVVSHKYNRIKTNATPREMQDALAYLEKQLHGQFPDNRD